MNTLNTVTQIIVEQSIAILKSNLVGVYLHGSAAMGCFNEKESDIDLIVVVKNDLDFKTKKRYLDMLIETNRLAPPKGIELSIVKEKFCNKFIYPTPFELHFSKMHVNWYKRNPTDYINKLVGTDKDLAAHFEVIFNRGKCLYGSGISEVFSPVDSEYYFDSIKNDIENADTEVLNNPVYIVLNLCRVLAYKQEKVILSKKEGGEWGQKNVMSKYTGLVSMALKSYITGVEFKWNAQELVAFAENMKSRIFE